MSIPTKKNISVKVTEKLLKYKDLEIKIDRMKGIKTITISVVTGTLGLIKKGLEKYIYNKSRVTSNYMNYRRSHYLEHLTS